MSRLHIDLETRSQVDLKTAGVYRYVRCPDFKILMASWSLDGSPIRTALSDDEIQAIPGLWDPDVTKVAHNAAFERVCFSEFGMRRYNGSMTWDPPYLPPEQWDDTQARAGALGYPQSLGRLALELGAAPKDSAGSRLISLFSKPRRDGGWNGPETHPLEWLDFIAYCEQDVDTLVEIDKRLGDFPTEHERAVYHTDQRINDRGIAIDLELAEEAVRAGVIVTQAQKERVTEITEGAVANAKSVDQLKAWLHQRGQPLPNLQAKTVKEWLEQVIPDDVREVLELRQELALAAPAKFASALESHVDGRLHGGFHYFGAHTGRWAGRRTQPHNLPRLAFTRTRPDGKEEWDRVAEMEAILTLKLGGLVSAEELKKLVRPLFVGPFTVVDYRSIEAFVIAWLAGEDWVLEVAQDHTRDIYVETAERMGGLTRPQGKIAVLALGFGGGSGSLRAMAGDRDYMPEGSLQAERGQSEACGVITGYEAKRILDATDEELYDRFVNPWRAANPNTVRLWRKIENAFLAGGSAGPHLYVERDGNDRYVRLPSGRAICYHKCGFRKMRKFNKRTREWEVKKVLSFWSPQGKAAETYGGRLAENATQAVARDLLADALVRLEAQGYPVALHVHDEVGVEGQHDVELIWKIVTTAPSWAEGLPVDGEGFVTERYRKG